VPAGYSRLFERFAERLGVLPVAALCPPCAVSLCEVIAAASIPIRIAFTLQTSEREGAEHSSETGTIKEP
jgi:hypothetical protein